MDIVNLVVGAGAPLVVVGAYGYGHHRFARRYHRLPVAPTKALALSAYLAADVTAGLPNEEMVRAAIVEYMADESSDVQARISRLESDLDFYVLGRGVKDTAQRVRVMAMQRRVHDWRNAKPVALGCRCANPVHIQVVGSEEARCGFCGGRAPVAKWYPDGSYDEEPRTGQGETR